MPPVSPPDDERAVRLRRAAKIDANQPEIVRGLRKAGALWVPLGWPIDGLMGAHGLWMPAEIKDPAQPPSKRRLTDDQMAFFRDCEAYGLPVAKVETLEDALKALGLMR